MLNNNLQQQVSLIFNEIYVGGKEATLGELLDIIESGARPRGGAENDGIPSIGAENIERFGVYDFSKDKYISEQFYSSLNRGKVYSGDVLLYKDGAYTGKVSMALDDFPHKVCAVNEHVFILRTQNNRLQFALYTLIARDDIRQKIYTLASSKAAQPGLNQNELRSVKILIPSESELVKFERFASPIMHQIARNANENRQLASLRDSLLPKLMGGEIDVSQVEI
ncbi:MAG: restriction endonuclease subunit S [Clostridia bacterium]|nr:restriction endonuclease subunit S [Clostridia bacterium]